MASFRQTGPEEPFRAIVSRNQLLDAIADYVLNRCSSEQLDNFKERLATPTPLNVRGTTPVTEGSGRLENFRQPYGSAIVRLSSIESNIPTRSCSKVDVSVHAD